MLPAIGDRNARQQPRRDLPVAANPAMPPADIGRVGRGIVLKQKYIAHQAGPGVASFKQIMAEDSVLREFTVNRLAEYVHIINSLADERALREDILINIGDGVGIGIDAGLAREKSCESRSAGAGNADADPRLEDAVSFGHAAELLVVKRAVQRVGEGAGELARRIARKLRVAVERDHVPHLFQAFGRADDRVEMATLAAQRLVEFFEFAALALPAHPQRFPLWRSTFAAR